MTDAGGLDLGNIIAIGVATGAFIFSAFTYRRNRISEQIKIAREQMDRILMKRQQAEGYMSDVKNNNKGYSPIEYFFHVEDVLRECEYFGRLIDTNEIKDKNTISYYSSRVFLIFSDMNTLGYETLQEILKMYPSSKIRDEMDNYLELLDNVGLYWCSVYSRRSLK